MLRYAIERNGGDVQYDNETGIATVSFNGIEKNYSVADNTVVNGRIIIDSSVLANDFNYDEESFFHTENDKFLREIDAAMALALIYNPESIHNTGNEIGAYIYVNDAAEETYYQFDGLVVGETIDGNTRGISLGNVDLKDGRRAVAWFHTHGPYTYLEDGMPDVYWDLFTDHIVNDELEFGDAMYSNYLNLNAYLSCPSGDLKYFNRDGYKSIIGNRHVPINDPSVTVIAYALPTDLNYQQ